MGCVSCGFGPLTWLHTWFTIACTTITWHCLVRELLADISGSGWQETELAALQLHSAVLIALRRSGVLPAASSDPDPIQSALLVAAQRAESMGYHYEEAQAIRQSAVEYENQSQFPRALEQFRLALGIADSIGDDGLATGIRASIAQIHSGQGNDPATSRVLRELETQLAADGGDELAMNLLQQGRIFIRSYRYPQAVEVLSKALNFENDSSIRSQVNLELAKAYFETGYATESRHYLVAGGLDLQQVQSYLSRATQAALSPINGLSGQSESMYLRAQALGSAGKYKQAIGVMKQLIDEILWSRFSVPGMLGAWYWLRHEELFEYYLQLQSSSSGSRQEQALESLLALSKLRYSVDPGDPARSSDVLRSLLLQRNNATNNADSPDLDKRIRAEKKMSLASFKENFGYLSKAGLHHYLDKLGSNEAVLTYHVTATVAHVWLGGNGRLRQRKLVNARGLYADLNAVRQATDQQSRDVLMSRLSAQLLEPIKDLLPDNIYLLASGPISGLPFAALRVEGRYLAERHTVVNLISFPANPGPKASLRFTSPQQVFLAGYPQAFSAGFATRFATSPEIKLVTDIFCN